LVSNIGHNVIVCLSPCISSSKYTCNRTQETDAQVLLMHKQDLDREKLTSMPRNPDQIWLLWHDESNEELTDLNSFKFNWTVTYRISAEASIGAYGITVAKSKPWSKRQFHSWIDEQLRQRYDQAAWYVTQTDHHSLGFRSVQHSSPRGRVNGREAVRSHE
jgi:hypothetical protein